MFARTPGRRFRANLGLSVLAAWGPWAATWVWSLAALSCDHCTGTLGGIAGLGPGWLPAFLTARRLDLHDGGWAFAAFAWGISAAFVAVLTAAAHALPRGRWAVWVFAAGSQAALAPLLVAAVRS